MLLSSLLLFLHLILCLTLFQNLHQVLTKGQEGGSPNPTTELDKVKEKRVEVCLGNCPKGTWRKFFEITGENFY